MMLPVILLNHHKFKKMILKTKSKELLESNHSELRFRLRVLKYIKLSLLTLLLCITACSQDDNTGDTDEDSMVNEICPEVSLALQEDANNKAKVTVEATSSITKDAIYTWKVIDKDGTHTMDSITTSGISWQLKEGETEFFVTVKTLSCDQDVEQSITHKLVPCEDTVLPVASSSEFLYRNFTFKDGYIYYAQTKLIGLGPPGVAIYKLDLSDTNALPIKVVDVSENITGWVYDLVFKDDILYVSVDNVIDFFKIYKIDTSIKEPSLVEAIDDYRARSKAIKGNDMYMVGGFKTDNRNIMKMDLTQSPPKPTNVITFSQDIGIATHILFEKQSLYTVIQGGEKGFRIYKINVDDPNIKQTLVFSGDKDAYIVNDMTLNGDNLYLLLNPLDGSDNTIIKKLDLSITSPKLEGVDENYDIDITNFEFYEGWLYMTGRNDNGIFEIVKAPACAL
ncbi:DUF5050 domain-containing protein [Aquimarina sp. ERC-38]|uniref:hypothetical protein n=1 Tax=Aquimarina sp. ERC-38 TaxID=2949996 RepID=UPI002245686F|nr:hypothetical protein [Aquimarina sp. ERC-38]UZO82505.1 DUF5050 domain-containing protein [Aquimarina sp. ERC-38]